MQTVVLIFYTHSDPPALTVNSKTNSLLSIEHYLFILKQTSFARLQQTWSHQEHTLK